MLELLGEEFTDGDRSDALNSMILLRSTFTQKRNRFRPYEADQLAVEARKLGRYSNEPVSRIAVMALERQITGNCDLLKEGE